jgi:hypothetical protein
MTTPVTVATHPLGINTPDGKKIGQIGQVQERDPAKQEKFGGKPWAAWVRKTLDGKPDGTPECFATFLTLKAATKYVEVAVKDTAADLTSYLVEAPVEEVKVVLPVEPAKTEPKRARGRPRTRCIVCKAPVVPLTDHCTAHTQETK